MIKKEWLPIWKSRPYTPILMSLVTDSTVFGFKKIIPQSRISCGADYWETESSSYLYLNSEIKDTVDLLFKLAIKNPKAFFRFFKVAYQKSIKFNQNSKKYNSNSTSNLSDSELIKNLDKFTRDFFDFYQYATIAGWFGYQQDNPLYEKMNGILRQKTKNQPENFANYLVILTNPPKLLKTSYLEKELLILASKVKKAGVKSQQQIKNHFTAELKKFYEKYKCLSFDFNSKFGWDLNHFSAQVAERINLDIAKKIKEINNYEISTEHNYKMLCQRLYLNKSEIGIFNLVRSLGYYKWVREYEFQEGLSRYVMLIDELGNRCGLNILQSRYILPSEWPKFLKNPSLAKKVCVSRLKNCFYFSQWKKESKIYGGQEAVKQYQKLKFIKEKNFSPSQEIKGTPAFSGRASGMVKIINRPKDLKKMKPGDILVSIATSPDLLTAMKKAVAIVTDEGGITCHAAIVSRELKIPCVVGTKIATKIFKDGDMAEVDAARGVVKKL